LSSIRTAAGRDIDKAYITLSALANLFEPCGVDAEDVGKAVEQMLSCGLLEPFDPNTELVSDGTKIGITRSGETHIELAVYDTVYQEQMALASGYRYARKRDEIAALSDLRSPENRTRVKHLFAEYALTEDTAKLKVPASEIYGSLRRFRSEFAALLPQHEQPSGFNTMAVASEKASPASLSRT
jgi:hypothetical protein